MNIGGIPLHLRGEVRGIFFDWLRSYRPDLVPRYEELYARGAYVGSAERERIRGSRCGRGARSGRLYELDPVTVPERRAPREPVRAPDADGTPQFTASR